MSAVNLYHPDLFNAITNRQTGPMEDYIRTHQFSAEDVDQIGILMLQHDQMGSALMLFEQLLQATPQRSQSYFNLGIAKAENAQLEEALHYIQKALQLEPNRSEAIQFLQTVQHRIQDRQAIPSIYLITVPKSGSIFLMNTLVRGLDLRFIQSSSRVYMPEDMAIFQNLEQMNREGGWISQEHLPPTKWNVYVLERLFEKWVVHVRDPRQALLSWIHHCQSFFKQGMVRYVEMYLPEDLEHYFTQSLEAQIDWQIECYLPLLLDFISGWLDLSNSERYSGRILLTQYENLIQDNQAFLDEILDFYAIDRARFRSPELQKQKGLYHFRQGRSDEWRDVFTQKQIQKSTAMIPEKLLQRFHWAVD